MLLFTEDSHNGSSVKKQVTSWKCIKVLLFTSTYRNASNTIGTSGPFLESKGCQNMNLTTYLHLVLRLRRTFQMRSSRNVLSSANTDLLSVLVRKETTLTVTATISV
jgi:hypothetical protein